MRGGGLYPLYVTIGAVIIAVAVVLSTLPFWAGLAKQFMQYVRGVKADAVSVLNEDLGEDKK
jgi:nitrogen fixation-related uncharacterized protein